MRAKEQLQSQRAQLWESAKHFRKHWGKRCLHGNSPRKPREFVGVHWGGRESGECVFVSTQSWFKLVFITKMTKADIMKV